MNRPSRLRRALAAIVLLATAWTALWPLVSAAHARMASEAIPLCHQAGMVVAMDEPVQDPALPGHPQPRFHCPLCVMAFYGAYTPSLHVEPPLFRCVVAFGEAHCAATPEDVSLALPQSRAPPLDA
jgi:hypothetical protein